MSGTVPCTYTFPGTFDAHDLLTLVDAVKITWRRRSRLSSPGWPRKISPRFDLSSLRTMRVGTGAAGLDAARHIESRTHCRVVVASGAMECPGFGHADINEPSALRLDGSTGLPLPGCRLRIDDDGGEMLPIGQVGHVRVSAPFASLGYWNDPEATYAVWTDGWYTTGDMGVLDEDGRLTLLGRTKEVINRSGHKILPIEVEQEIAKHASVFSAPLSPRPIPNMARSRGPSSRCRTARRLMQVSWSRVCGTAASPLTRFPRALSN